MMMVFYNDAQQHEHETAAVQQQFKDPDTQGDMKYKGNQGTWGDKIEKGRGREVKGDM